jgi:electron transport complex protein RnfG
MSDDRKLPVVGPDIPVEDAPTEGGTPPDSAIPVEIEVPSWRLVTTLAVAGALAGLAIVLVFSWAQPRIDAHRARVLQEAVQEVLKGPERYEPLFVYDGQVTDILPAGVDSTNADRVFLGFDEGGGTVGFAVQGEASGYQDVIRLIFGYDHMEGRVLAMKVLESKETPGLGDKIIKDMGFVGQFEGVLAPILGIKTGDSTGDDKEVEMITGATISSRTVIGIINDQLARIGPALDSYRVGGGQ